MGMEMEFSFVLLRNAGRGRVEQGRARQANGYAGSLSSRLWVPRHAAAWGKLAAECRHWATKEVVCWLVSAGVLWMLGFGWD